MSKENAKLVSVVGHFGFGQNLLNGQTIKTKTVTEALENTIGKDEVIKIDTHGGVKTYLKLPFQLLSALQNSKNIVIFPAHNGLKIIAPLLILLNLIYHRRLHYCVIGGWLPEMCKNKKLLTKVLKKFDYIYVETTTMEKALEQQDFTNIVVMPNFKNIVPLTEAQLVYPTCEPFKLCTFSRVMKEKGIEDAIEAVKFINEKAGRKVYSLDIYGQIDANQTEWFTALQSRFPDFVHYEGAVAYDKSVDVLKSYYALLFPTRYYTEGIPGTIIDAYAAGVPVIASKWESFEDIIEAGCTGLGYNFEDINQFEHLLEFCAKQPDALNDLRINCLRTAVKFSPQDVLNKMKLYR